VVKVVVGEILPLALVVTISPINVIPVILLLFTKRPLVNASFFFVGFVAGVAAILVALVAFAEAVDLSPGSGHSTWVAVLKLALGAYLLMAAVRKFRGRPRAGVEGAMPKWMNGIAEFQPGRSLGAGLALGSVNPKNVVVGFAAAATIASETASRGQEIGAIAIYVLVAVLGVAAPILVTAFLGDRAPKVLEGWRAWLTQNNATVMSVLFLIFGVVLIGQGIEAA
jgi:threonine/homoserine/homoserine lactone efflux protein